MAQASELIIRFFLSGAHNYPCLAGSLAFGQRARFDDPHPYPPVTTTGQVLGTLFCRERHGAKDQVGFADGRDWILSDHLALI